MVAALVVDIWHLILVNKILNIIIYLDSNYAITIPFGKGLHFAIEACSHVQYVRSVTSKPLNHENKALYSKSDVLYGIDV
jgi:hypothetical protein